MTLATLKTLTDSELMNMWNAMSAFITDVELLKAFASEFTRRGITLTE